MAIGLALAWPALLSLGSAIEPDAPAGAATISGETLDGTSCLVVLAIVVGLLRRYWWAATVSTCAAVVLGALVVTDLIGAHSGVGGWRLGQMAIAAALIVASRTLRRAQVLHTPMATTAMTILEIGVIEPDGGPSAASTLLLPGQ